MIRKSVQRFSDKIMLKKKMARTSGIEPLSMRGQRMALPIYQVREY